MCLPDFLVLKNYVYIIMFHELLKKHENVYDKTVLFLSMLL